MGLLDFWKSKQAPAPEPARELSPAPPTRPRRRTTFHAKSDWVRQFEAGKINRLTSGGSATLVDINQDLALFGPIVTARARHLSKNDDYVRRFIQIFKRQIVGAAGITMRPQITDPDGTRDDVANEAVESAWREYRKAGFCEITGRLSMRDLENMVVEHLARDGEFFAKRLAGRGPFGHCLQVIDPISVPMTLNAKFESSGNDIINGVEVDTEGRPVAYHVRVRPNFTGEIWTHSGQHFHRIAASKIIHIFRPEYANQTRGYSPMASAIMRLLMLNGYEEAALVAARVGASHMGFFTSETEGGQYQGDDEDSDGAPIEEVEPGIFVNLPAGVDVKEYKPNYPTIGYAEFITKVLQGIAAGLGISYTSLSGDLSSVNFSSIRTAVLEDREGFMDFQVWLIEHFEQGQYDDWLISSLALGKIKIKGQPVGLVRLQKFSNVTFAGRRWQWVDPLKDMQANALAIERRIRSVSSVIRESGHDPRDVFQEIARENEQMAELGITPDQVLQAIEVTDDEENENA